MWILMYDFLRLIFLSYTDEQQIASLVPPILTCLIGRQLGGTADLSEQFALRDLAAALLGLIATKYSHSSHTLKPRLARSCLKTLLDPSKPFGAHYGAIIGLHAVGKFVRIDAIWRLTYLDHPRTQNFGVLIGFDIQF